MRFLQLTLFSLMVLLTGCAGEQPVDKAILGTWIQDVPTSMTSAGLQTTSSDTVLEIRKNGEVQLTRNLDIIGQGLPEDGVQVSLELRGQWEISDGQLKQIQDTALILPRTDSETNRQWAEELQSQAEQSPPSVKDIISVNRKELILQDRDTGTTDVYRRK